MRTLFDLIIDFEKSSGSYLYDKNSRSKYLDLYSMFSSLPLGYNHPIFNRRFDQEIKFIAHLKMSNNLCQSEEFNSFKRKFIQISFHENIHFCSTGALAVEAALKCGFEYKKDKNSIVLGVKNSFHGINSWGFLTDPDILSVKERVVNYPRNNWKIFELDELIECLENPKENISSVIVEPIQCTAGDVYLAPEKLRVIQALCKRNDICFIVDEIQTGFGVTGEYWYSKKIGLDPDIIVFGKKSQISGIMANNKYSEAITSKHRKLEVTFDGDLIDAIRCGYIIDAIETNDYLNNVNTKSILLKEKLSKYFNNYRSIGHLIAFDFFNKEERDMFVRKMISRKVLVNATVDKSVRLRPNLSLTNDELEDLLYKIQ